MYIIIFYTRTINLASSRLVKYTLSESYIILAIFVIITLLVLLRERLFTFGAINFDKVLFVKKVKIDKKKKFKN